jgi:hypothetical protein
MCKILWPRRLDRGGGKGSHNWGTHARAVGNRWSGPADRAPTSGHLPLRRRLAVAGIATAARGDQLLPNGNRPLPVP